MAFVSSGPVCYTEKDMVFALAASLVVIADQLSKFLIRTNLDLGQSMPEDGLVRLSYVRNTGAAFGLLANQTFLIILTAVVGIAILLLYYSYPPFGRLPVKVGLGLLLGGSVGNLADRLRSGYVTDFIDLRVWPVFNLADSAIVVGVAILAYFLIFLALREGHPAR
jgi:signal peptidase II